MAQILALLLTLMQLFTIQPPEGDAPRTVTNLLRSGEWLRMHVIAQDDTRDMQQVKLLVRDAVQACYAANRPEDAAMLQTAASLLPQLTVAARDAASSAGFTGPVDVSLGLHRFDERDLAGMTIPAGTYPALIIRLGDGLGRNWWGLIDPEAALMLAAANQEDAAETGSTPAAEEETKHTPVLWDWSWQALLSALFGLPLTAQ